MKTKICALKRSLTFLNKVYKVSVMITMASQLHQLRQRETIYLQIEQVLKHLYHPSPGQGSGEMVVNETHTRVAHAREDRHTTGVCPALGIRGRLSRGRWGMMDRRDLKFSQPRLPLSGHVGVSTGSWALSALPLMWLCFLGLYSQSRSPFLLSLDCSGKYTREEEFFLPQSHRSFEIFKVYGRMSIGYKQTLCHLI